MTRKPRDGYLDEYVKNRRGIAFNSRNKFEVIEDPTKTFPEGGFFGRYDFLVSLSGEVWPEGLIVCDYRKGEPGDELMVRYKESDRKGYTEKFLVSTKSDSTWILTPSGVLKLVSYARMELERKESK